ncbi:hypothetical protein AVEN_261530-1, partial [Araneus ventricosus]
MHRQSELSEITYSRHPHGRSTHEPIVMGAVLRSTSVPNLLSWWTVFQIYRMVQ